MIIGIVGFAQTGKDTVAKILSEHGFQRVAFADALKRVTMRIFDFTYDQMWGTLEQKEAPDLRYPRKHTWSSILYPDAETKCLCCGELLAGRSPWDVDTTRCYLNGRYALKIIGTEGARHCYSNIWVERALKDAERISRGFVYTDLYGAEQPVQTTGRAATPRNVVFTDCRFINEVDGIQRAGGQVYRIKRVGYEKPTFDHPSETEQLQIPDDRLTGVIHNDGTLDALRAKVLRLIYPDFDNL